MGLVNSSTRTLGDLGEIGPFAFGMWRFTSTDVDALVALVEAALDNGMNLIDTADVYGLDWNGTGFGTVEENLGAVLRQAPGLRDRSTVALALVSAAVALVLVPVLRPGLPVLSAVLVALVAEHLMARRRA